MGEPRPRWHFEGRRTAEGVYAGEYYVWKRKGATGEDFEELSYAHPVATFWPN